MSQGSENAGVRTEGGRHGAVAGTIHGGVHNNYYELPPPDASPEQKFASALRFLYSGQATTARRLLDEVIVENPDSSHVCFYWLLAFFSGRTYWEMSVEERDQVTTELKRIGELRWSKWSTGIAVIQRLLATVQSQPGPSSETAGIEADIDRLPDDISAAIRSHLERLIQGTLKDELWHRDVSQAEAGQKLGNRRSRVWKFFEPDPKPPRVLPVRKAAVAPVTAALIGIAAVAVVGGSGTLGSLVLQRDDISAVVALVVALAAAAAALKLAADWRFRDDTLLARERQRRTIRSGRTALRPGGFAAEVNELYLKYLRRLAPPDDRDRGAWLTDAYVPLCRLRDDLAEAYREQPVSADKVKWLIRFQVGDLRQRWARGESLDPKLEVPTRLRFASLASLAASPIATMWVLQSALHQDVLLAISAFLALTFAGTVAATLGLRILAEQKRVLVANVERDRLLKQYWAEYRRWQQRLADRPTDIEMAQWLDCDRRLLLDRAIQGYRLKWSDVQAYASLEAGGPNSRKARVKNGPWRYSRYRLLVFLLTSDGVRQLTTELDFGKATFHHWDRTNYRYDAVAAVQVSVRDDEASEFHLFLVNGTDIQVAVTEIGRPGTDEDPQVLADAAEDATGLRHTLFVLEGVAAEGRRWWKGPAYRRATGPRT
jgi:hypothetical protein